MKLKCNTILSTPLSLLLTISILLKLLSTGLEIGGFASPNANHFWSNGKSLWPTDSPYFWVTANHFWPMMNHFSNGFAKRPFFGLHPFFREILYTRNTSANKLLINLKNDSIFLSKDQKIANHFLFLKSSPDYQYYRYFIAIITLISEVCLLENLHKYPMQNVPKKK